MKNKIRFIFPRLLVITVALGLLTLIVGVLFKIVLFGTIIFGLGKLSHSFLRRRDNYHNIDMPEQYPTYGYQMPYSNQAIMPIHHINRNQKQSIVPIY